MTDEYQTQCDALLEFLREAGERGVTAMEILGEVGSARGAARIKDLRDRGWLIRTDTVVIKRNGRPRRVAKYVFEGRIEDRDEPTFAEVSLWP